MQFLQTLFLVAKSFIKGAILLLVCGLLGKVIGAFYRIPFSWIVGAEGVGLYQLVYPFYALILTISTSGLPSSISKLLSEQWAKGEHSLARKTFKYCMIMLLIFSAIGSLLIALLAYPISKIQGNQDAFVCYLAIAPAVFFVGIISGIRGYFQAKENMTPTAVSGLIEQVIKLVFGLGFAYIFNQSVVSSTVGALFGVTISEILAAIYLIISYNISKKKMVAVVLTETAVGLSNKQIRSQILKIALPIALGGLILPITLLIDSGLIVKILSKTMSVSQATTLYGLQSGVVGSISNLPVVASMAVATAILPKISKEKVYNNNEVLTKSISHAIMFVLLVAIPCAICFYVFSEQIVLFLYNSSFSTAEIAVSTRLLKISCINIVFLSLAQVSSSVLQGLGKVKTPMWSLLIGAVIKTICLIVLVNNPQINIYGAEISDAACYLVAAVINIVVIHKTVSYNNFVGILKVAAVSLIVGLIAYFSNLFAYPTLSVVLSLLISGGLTVCVYAVFVMLIVKQENRKKVKFAYQKVRKTR